MKKNARTKLADRNIHWEEKYTESTEEYKIMYQDVVGKGSYFRWEGKDVDSGDEYFVVVGPAKIKSPEASWFAGSRKFPYDWAAGGKYFAEITEAMKYANETWGTPFPKNFNYGYTSSDLKGIAKKVKDWKSRRKQKESKEDYAQGEYLMKKNANEDFPMSISELLIKEAGAPRWIGREEYWWVNVDNIYSDENFNKMVAEYPSFEQIRNLATKERMKRRMKMAEMYGQEYVNQDFYFLFVGHKPGVGKGEGTYMYAITPYAPYRNAHGIAQAYDKFGVFRFKINLVEPEDVQKEADKYLEHYLKTFGTVLNMNDLSVSGTEEANIVIKLNKNGGKKVYESPKYQEHMEYYKNKYGVKTKQEAFAKYQEEIKQWKKIKEAHEKAQQSGEALMFNIPPPPEIGLVQRKRGQQYFTKMIKEKSTTDIQSGVNTEDNTEPASTPETTDISVAQDEEKYGFDSLHEAIDFAMAQMPSSFPAAAIAQTKNTTAAELKVAREEHEKEKQMLSEKEDKPEGSEVAQETPVPEETSIDTPAQKIEQPVAEPQIAQEDSVGTEKKMKFFQDDDEYEQKNAKINTLTSLIKLAETLDKEGKCEESEEIHKILRKHIGK